MADDYDACGDRHHKGQNRAQPHAFVKQHFGKLSLLFALRK